jgi:hypothetical protein
MRSAETARGSFPASWMKLRLSISVTKWAGTTLAPGGRVSVVVIATSSPMRSNDA